MKTDTKRDFATPPTYERGDEIALRCKKTGKVSTGRVKLAQGGVLYVHYVHARMVRSHRTNDYDITSL